MHQGILVETTALVEVRNTKLAVVRDFQKVFEDSCASLIRGSGIEASVIFLGPRVAVGCRPSRLRTTAPDVGELNVGDLSRKVS